ncbi:hypothetical protein N7532_004475 [Penicillium argentinense]|uniref:Copper-fist domain-containing protein n=1 Tax=Penicillium argentinense TaxID=1131581 RepID=A0A9W9FPF2_9EURO|nr:uncharacterized protein N7532_004475 [Penicillium argentinense]KAJ5103946.1 hypothetical protein N7532_004475 [Penicillium argentinense]
MLIDGQKWACEACIRGHRVTSCKHHGTLFLPICSVSILRGCKLSTVDSHKTQGATLRHLHHLPLNPVHRTQRTCPRKARSRAQDFILKSNANTTRLIPHREEQGNLDHTHTHLGLLPGTLLSRVLASNEETEMRDRHGADASFGSIESSARQTISPPPQPSRASTQSSVRISRSGSTSASASESNTPVYIASVSRRGSALTDKWSGSESGNEGRRTQSTTTMPDMSRPINVPHVQNQSQTSSSLSSSAPGTLALDPILTQHTFDPMYSLLPSTMSEAQLAQNLPMISPLEGDSPFDFPLDPSLTLNESISLGYPEDTNVDVTEGLLDGGFFVEDWSPVRFMYSPHTGNLEPFPPVTQCE